MKTYIQQYRLVLVYLTTSAIICGSLVLAYAVRFDFAVPASYWPRITQLLPVALGIKLLVLWRLGCFRGWWRYVSTYDLVQIAKASVIGSVGFSAYAVFVYHLEMVPRSVLFLDGIFCFLAIGGARFLIRMLREAKFPVVRENTTRQTRALIVGAGQAGQTIVREIRSNNRLNYFLVGYVDDDPHKKNALLQGLAVLGTQKDIERLVRVHRVEDIIIAIPSATGQQIRALVEHCRKLKVRFKILPGVGDLIDGRVTVQQMRDVNLDDLLGREPISLDVTRIRQYLEGKRVLVTGAGGSIGSEICRQVARFHPAKLILFENAETPLFDIEKELSGRHPHLPIVPVIGDIRNRSRVNGIFDQQLPQVVFHAAAYKHVPMMEYNPAEAVNNNIQGTRILAEAADQFRVETFVMISTDKAVRPTNIMGSSKRVAEMYVQSLNQQSRTNFVTTRFGNVLGSNGSVIPTFREQIAKGGPVTVTDPEVTRFFMTIPEATQLVLQAGSMGQGGEIFLFDMGVPVKILDLAKEMIRLSGLVPYEDIDIVFTGLRPGEKLYEELLLDGEGILPTTHEKIRIARAVVPDYQTLIADIEDILADARQINHDAVRNKLRHLVPEFQPAPLVTGRKVLSLPLAGGHQVAAGQ